MADIFLNDVYVGQCQDGNEYIKAFKESRRNGEVDRSLNISYNRDNDFVYIEGTPGRVRRPLIIVRDGKSTFTKDVKDKIDNREWGFDDLIENGVVEFLDALEEESVYVAMYEENLTVDHTHLEISPMLMFGLNTSTVPFSDYNEASRLMRGQKTVRQAIGLYATNFLRRKETDRDMLVNPQKPLVGTYSYDLMNMDSHPAGQNLTVAIMSYEGYNMEDGLIFNQSSIDRGLQRSFYFKLYSTSEIKYPGGLQDKIGVPQKDVKGYRTEDSYKYLEEDGIIYPGQRVGSGDVLIGKISPPKFVEEIEGFGQMVNMNVDSSVVLKEEEKGVVSLVFMVENLGGDKEVNIVLRDQRIPIVGDKFASRHGQKGIIGAMYKQSDMPFSSSGLIPDLVFSPHSIPGRKTVSHMLEALGGKVAALSGEFTDGSPFEGDSEEELRGKLKELGLDTRGVETMYDPKTGKQMNAEVYTGSIYYLRLKHQVLNKIQARGTGPVQLLTRQPAEGRIRGGGLKLGEMEKDTLISHGSSLLLKERFSSDQTKGMVCNSCGHLTDPYLFRYRNKCPMCGGSKFDSVELAYAFKLFSNELRSMGISMSFGTKDRFFD